MPRILVVDDDPDLVQLMRALFETAGFETMAPAAAETRAVAEAVRPDLIVLDIRMPPLSGWEVLAQLRGSPRTRRIPVLMVSASEEVNDRVRALRQGADDFVTKPFDGGELIARAQRMISRSDASESVLRGQLDAYPLPMLLQNLEQQRQSGTLKVSGTFEPTLIALENGRVVGVAAGSLAGEEALWAVLDRSQGDFTFSQEPPPLLPKSSHLEGRSIQSILLDAGWLNDELEKRRAWLPAPGERLLLLGEPPALDEELADLPVRWIVDHLLARPGIPFEELISALPLAPKRARFAVAWLIEQGVVERLGSPDLDLDRSPLGSLDLLSLAGGGGATRTVRVTVLVTPEVLPAFHRLIVASAPDEARRAGFTTFAGSRIRFPHQGVQVEIVLHLLSLDAVAEIFDLARRSSGVVLWIGEEPGQVTVPPRLIAAAAGRNPRLLLVTTPGSGRRPVLDALGPRSRWRHSERPVKGLSDLLRELFAVAEKVTSPP